MLWLLQRRWDTLSGELVAFSTVAVMASRQMSFGQCDSEIVPFALTIYHATQHNFTKPLGSCCYLVSSSVAHLAEQVSDFGYGLADMGF